jgi:DNA invertase Pin-like site-specific DNA recombinase
MELVGYARVSSREERQVLDRQVDALRVAGCERIYDDRGSGVSADRLGRRAGELIRLVDELDRRGVGFRALNAPFDTTTPAGRAFMQIQAAFAEMERNLIRQRISEGIAAARARGRKGGRPRVMTPERLRYAQHLMADQTRSIPAICRELGDLPASTLYHYVHADGSLKAPGRKLLDADMHGAGADPAKEASGGPAAVEAPRARADA